MLCNIVGRMAALLNLPKNLFNVVTHDFPVVRVDAYSFPVINNDKVAAFVNNEWLERNRFSQLPVDNLSLIS
jgi:hypothetical protein